jgi:signal transduction histidine kinase
MRTHTTRLDGIVPADRCAELMVKDTGIGIPEEELPLLGNRFHRVETPGARSRGLASVCSHQATIARRYPTLVLTQVARFSLGRRSGSGLRVGAVARRDSQRRESTRPRYGARPHELD